MKKLVVFVVCLLFVLSLAYAADYVGSKKCKMCHKGAKKGEVWEKWEKGHHAKAFETLKTDADKKNPEGLAGHTTGFGKGGYKAGDANAAKFEGVGCESCHGPGSDYKKMSVMKDRKKAIEAGMVMPTEALCKECHNKKSPDFKGFDFKEYMKKIDHTYREKK